MTHLPFSAPSELYGPGWTVSNGKWKVFKNKKVAVKMDSGAYKIVEMKDALADNFPASAFNDVFGEGWEKTV